MKEGIYTIGAQEYHDDPCPEPSLSASIAHIIDTRSPLHAWMAHPRLNPEHKRMDKDEMDLGTAAHMALLDRDLSRVVFVEADDWRTKAARQARDDARSEGRVALLSRLCEPLQEMVKQAGSAWSKSEFGVSDEGRSEQTIIWKHDGLWCRSRLDWIDSHERYIMDYKTTTNAHPEACVRKIYQLGYDLKAEFYVRAAKHATGADYDFFWLFQEISPPYACSIIAAGEQMRILASVRLDRAIKLWGECLASNKWPAYSTRTHWAEPPAWASYRSEDEEVIDNVGSLRKAMNDELPF